MLAAIWGGLTSRLAGPIATAAAIGLLIMLGVTRVELAGSRHHAEALDAQINAPVTGWAARLGACRASVGQLTAEIADQTAKTKAFALTMGDQLAAAEKLATEARRGRATAEAKAARLASIPVTADACKDMAATDAALLESLH